MALEDCLCGQTWKPWRERIAEARVRGQFTQKDLEDALSPLRCAVAEQEVRGVLDSQFGYAWRQWLDEAGRYGDSNLGNIFPHAVMRNDFDYAETVLDQIEDIAMKIKRERTPRPDDAAGGPVPM